MSRGVLYGVSTGPGDPELLTLKAMRTIGKCEVIAVPRTKGENTMALDIIKAEVDISDKRIIYLDFKMTRNKEELRKEHEEQAAQIMEYLQNGINVAMLNIGDASLYGTYCYIRDIVDENGYDTQTIAGVTSFSAIAAVLNKSLTSMNKPLMIVPGSYNDMDSVLKFPGSKVLMKSGKALVNVKQAIDEAGLTEKASLVANCGLPTERVYKNIKDSEDNEGYFATILISSDEELR